MVDDVLQRESGFHGIVSARCTYAPGIDHSGDVAHRPHALVLAVFPVPIVVVVDDHVQFAVHVHHRHAPHEIAGFRRYGHRSGEGSNRGKAVVQLTRHLVGEHGTEGITNGIESGIVDAVHLAEGVHNCLCEVVVFTRRGRGVQEPFTLCRGPVVFGNGVSHDELLFLCKSIKLVLLREVFLCSTTAVEGDDDRQRDTCICGGHRQSVLALHPVNKDHGHVLCGGHGRCRAGAGHFVHRIPIGLDRCAIAAKATAERQHQHQQHHTGDAHRVHSRHVRHGHITEQAEINVSPEPVIGAR